MSHEQPPFWVVVTILLGIYRLLFEKWGQVDNMEREEEEEL